MYVPFMIYFEFVVRRIPGCEASQDGSFTVKTKTYKACRFVSIIVKSSSSACGPRVYRGKDPAYKFLADTLQDESWLKTLLPIKSR